MEKCIINEELKLAENEKGELYFYLVNSKKFISSKEFENCDLGDNTKFVFYTIDEAPPKKKVYKKNDINRNNNQSFVFDSSNYSLSPGKFELKELTPLILKEEDIPIKEELPLSNSISDIFVGGAASVALALSVFQQIRQKKKEAESSACCNNNKIEINSIKTELKAVKKEIEAKHESSNKAMHAEIIEHYKEMKEMKDDFDEVKDVIEKIIDKVGKKESEKKDV